MNYYKPAAASILAAALATPFAALAAPVVGLDPTGTGTYTTYADLWTNITDTAVVTGFVPGAIVGPGGIAPYVTELHTQTVIGTMSNSNTGAIVTPPGLNTSFEMTKVVRFEELVTSQNATTATFGLAPSQSAAMDVDPTRAGVQNFAVFFDQITPGGPSQAVPGNGVDTVRCYGTGVTGAAATVGGAAGDAGAIAAHRVDAVAGHGLAGTARGDLVEEHGEVLHPGAGGVDVHRRRLAGRQPEGGGGRVLRRDQFLEAHDLGQLEAGVEAGRRDDGANIAVAHGADDGLRVQRGQVGRDAAGTADDGARHEAGDHGLSLIHI